MNKMLISALCLLSTACTVENRLYENTIFHIPPNKSVKKELQTCIDMWQPYIPYNLSIKFGGVLMEPIDKNVIGIEFQNEIYTTDYKNGTETVPAKNIWWDNLILIDSDRLIKGNEKSLKRSLCHEIGHSFGIKYECEDSLMSHTHTKSMEITRCEKDILFEIYKEEYKNLFIK